VREFTTALYHLRAKQLGFSLDELFNLNYGELMDMITESANDHAQYDYKATQADIDEMFG